MFDWQSIVKYVLEGLAVTVAIWLIPTHRFPYSDMLLVALTAMATFAILDQFSPFVAIGARQGTGFAIGYQQVGLGNEKDKDKDKDSENICQMIGDICTYNPNVTPEQVSKFVCKQMYGNCVPVNACKHTQSCEWENDAEQLPDSAGRACAMVGNKCQLTMAKTVASQ